MLVAASLDVSTDCFVLSCLTSFLHVEVTSLSCSNLVLFSFKESKRVVLVHVAVLNKGCQRNSGSAAIVCMVFDVNSVC